MTALQQSIAEDKLLSLFAAQLNIEQAQLAGDDSVTMEAQVQTVATLFTALTGLQAAITGVNTTGEDMKKATLNIQKEVEDYRTEQQTEMIINIAFMCGDLFLGAVGAAAAAVGERGKEAAGAAWFKRKSTYYILKVVADVGDTARDLVDATSSLVKLTSKFPPEMQDFAASVAGSLADLSQSNTSNASVASLTSAARRLNSRLPGMGTGFWSEYVAASKDVYNPYLTGFNSKVSAATQSYVDLLIAQSNYGNDFVTQGTRLVSAMQQSLINQAQIHAHNATQHAMNQAYDVVDEFMAYNLMQESILTIQLTTLALQMYSTIQQVCQSYSYQTTRLYHQCVGPNKGNNVLNSLCSAVSNAAGPLPSFQPFLMEPCESSTALATAAQAYLKQLEKMYTSAAVVNAYVTNSVWGTDASGTDSPFIPLKMQVYEPPQCDSTHGFNATVLTECNSAQYPSPPPGVAYVNGTACLEPGASLPAGATCCEVTRFNANCTFDPPTNVPYITPAAFKAFSDDQEESWGKLDFAIEPQMLDILSSYDEVFIRGISVYLEGASITMEIANDLNVRLEPAGQMVTRVLNQDWRLNDTCASYVAEDPTNLCVFNNFSYVGAPSGSSNTVSYTMYYYNANSSTIQCRFGMGAQPVFYDQSNREIECQSSTGPVPCFHYCTDLDFASLEAGNAKAFHTTSGSFNFASVYSSFRLTIFNKFGANQPVEVRSMGIRLQDVKAIHIGMWLKTNGRNSAQMDTCDDIKEKGLVFAQAQSNP